jgi:hypothetical protein
VVNRNDIVEYTRKKQELQMILEERLMQRITKIDVAELVRNPRDVIKQLYLEEGSALFGEVYKEAIEIGKELADAIKAD